LNSVENLKEIRNEPDGKTVMVEGVEVPVQEILVHYSKDEDLWKDDVARTTMHFNRAVKIELYLMVHKKVRKLLKYKRLEKLIYALHGITWKIDPDSPYVVILYKMNVPVKMFRMWF
jgi:hypothetical protein